MMESTRLRAGLLVVLGLAIAAMSVYVAEVDDAPGAAAIGLLVLMGSLVLAARLVRGRLPAWAVGTSLAAGLALALLLALLMDNVSLAPPLFAGPDDVPSIVGVTPPPGREAAVQRAREAARAAMAGQNVPGLSVAVGSGGTLLWTEGFGWRDATTATPVGPDTRFLLGTAAPVVAPTAASLGLVDTGLEPAAAWSPEHIGEPEEDAPPFRLVRALVLEPLGLVASDYPLAGNRATVYVPRSDSDPRRGRRLAAMRDLVCCADGMAAYATPADLVRFTAATRTGDVDGRLAGGLVVSVRTQSDGGLAVAVMSNIAYADTAALAEHIRDVFAATGESTAR